jgi:SAM-dependent methyltransferase
MDSTFWDQRFGADEYAYGRDPNDFVRDEASRIPAGPVLCLAEGEGRNAVFLAGRGHTVTTVDFSREGLKKTERLAAEKNVKVTTIHGDLSTWEPAPGSFAGIVATFAHLPPDVRRRVHGWIARALKPGGVFLLEAYTPDQLKYGHGGPKVPELLMTLAALREELAPLVVDVGRELVREIHEGPFHGGPSAVVQIAAHRAD